MTLPTRRPAEKIAAHCRGALARCKVPRRVEIMEPFPPAVGGKVRKAEPRERYGS
ncbi:MULTISPECIES: hypothetical protein [unclassified Streptomyces]|uniref:hypothetical protein n=1 Tax=unclassified Streptomyces TaxID=2593676 RepID=UPI003329461F